jgi:phage gpG-like protein
MTLDDWIRRAKTITAESFEPWIQEAAMLCVPLAVSGCKRHFTEQRGPDGQPWPALKFDRPSGPGIPLRDSGRLMASIQGRAEDGTIVLGTNRVGATSHQYGATIVPVNAKYLTIPTTLEAKRAGSPRDYPGELVPRVNRARTKGVLLAKGESSNPKWNRPGGWHVAYILTTGPIEIPARPFIGFSNDTASEIAELASEHVVSRYIEALTTG